MKPVPLEHGPVGIDGALDVDRVGTGIVPRRLPSWTRPQINDVMMAFVVTMPAGCRLTLSTTSRTVELDVMVSRFRVEDQDAGPAVFDLVVGGELVGQVPISEGHMLVIDRVDLARSQFLPGEPSTVTFDDLPEGQTELEIWLPHNAVVELRELRVDDDAVTTASGPSATEGGAPRRRWIHYGSSISHCLEAPSPTGTWPVIVARGAGVDLLDLGFAGSAHLDPFVARTIRDERADFISMKVGINVVNGDTLKERTFAPFLDGFIDTVREGHGSTPLMVVSPIVCPPVEQHPGPTVLGADGRFGVTELPPEQWNGGLTLGRIREVISEIVAARRSRGDENLHYLDGLSLFGPDDVGDLPDTLHPNPQGYVRMAERFAGHAFGPGGAFASERAG